MNYKDNSIRTVDSNDCLPTITHIGRGYPVECEKPNDIILRQKKPIVDTVLDNSLYLLGSAGSVL